MLYRGGPFADWAALGDAVRTPAAHREHPIEMIVVHDSGEETARRADGFGNVDSIIAKPKKAKG